MGRLKLTGRLKEIFKTSKGKYIAPAKLENLLMAHESIEVCCVSGANQTQPFAMVMLNEELRPQVQDDAALKKDRKSTRLNSSHVRISYAVFCLKKKKIKNKENTQDKR